MQNSENVQNLTQKCCFCNQSLKKYKYKADADNVCTNCCQYIGKGNDVYWCETGKNCDFIQMMGYAYFLCSNCIYSSSSLLVSSFELIQFSLNKKLKKNKK